MHMYVIINNIERIGITFFRKEKLQITEQMQQHITHSVPLNKTYFVVTLTGSKLTWESKL